jgi:SNF2 family DNA or RNA helicase
LARAGDKLNLVGDDLEQLVVKFKRSQEQLDYLKTNGEAPLGNFKTEPWAHQLLMAHWIGIAPGVLVHAGMGVGKTKAAIDACTNYNLRQVLILCPKSVAAVWKSEFEKHCAWPHVVAVLDSTAGTVRKRVDKARIALAKVRKEHVTAIVLNYEAAWRAPMDAYLLDQAWDLIILDESQRIKSPSGKASRYVQRLRFSTSHMALLTGTPMPHSPLDIYPQFRAMDPGIFGTSVARFREQYAVMGGFENKQIVNWRNMDHLQERMSPVTVQVSRDVLDLPEETETKHLIDLQPEERRVYLELEEELIVEIEAGTVVASNCLTRLLRLQQTVCGHLKTTEGNVVDIGKSRYMALTELLEDIGPDEPVVVFCRFRKDLDNVADAARDCGRMTSELSGRRNELAEWQDDGPQVLAVQIQSGGVGIDLTRARYAIYYSIGYSLGDYLQARARVHRPGQERPVTHIHLVTRATVDRDIYRAIRKREDLIASVLDGLKR